METLLDNRPSAAELPTDTKQSTEMHFIFGTKAETLDALQSLVRHSIVGPLLYFSVRRWREARDQVLDDILHRFSNNMLVVRSSAQIEDHGGQSMAGAFTSCLNVDGTARELVVVAIEQVIASYDDDLDDQVLVQPMLEQISVSGVITTHVLDDGAPYYVINYDDESGKTDTITGGTGANKTVLIHRKAERNMIDSERVARWLGLAREVESVCGGVPLDIEYAQTCDGRLFLLQVRQIAAQKNWKDSIAGQIETGQQYLANFIRQAAEPHGVVGSYFIWGEMPDWNPAEIIGSTPRPLAASLYQYLVTDEVWRLSRSQMGYRHPTGQPLMTILGGHPYIDVRNSFNSFLPSDLDDGLAHRLVDAWLDRLKNHPELHDKVEFEVAQTALDFNFDAFFQQHYGERISAAEFSNFKDSARHLTRKALDLGNSATLKTALSKITVLQDLQAAAQHQETSSSELSLLRRAQMLLADCKRLGTLPFAIVARHAFIAEILLRTAVKREALKSERLDQFKRSLITVLGHMSEDMRQVLQGDADPSFFLQQYGHLRPGTYDILSLRYDQRDDLLTGCALPKKEQENSVFALTGTEKKALSGLLQEAGFDHISPQELLTYAETAIVGREHAKFVFSKNLSDAIELVAQWGAIIGLNRDDLSYLSIQQLVDNLHRPLLVDNESYYRKLIAQVKSETEVAQSLRLNYLIRDIRDIYVVPLHRAAPNFVSKKRLEGETILLDSHALRSPNLMGKIVCIENADPGFDWIFTCGIMGLITKFGGSNSHMAIRCAEFNLPAAIGCGEQTFDLLVRAGRIELNPADKIVRPVYG